MKRLVLALGMLALVAVTSNAVASKPSIGSPLQAITT